MSEIIISGGVRYRTEDAKRLGVKADRKVAVEERSDADRTTTAHVATAAAEEGSGDDGDTSGTTSTAVAGDTGGPVSTDTASSGEPKTGTGSKKGK